MRPVKVTAAYAAGPVFKSKSAVRTTKPADGPTTDVALLKSRDGRFEAGRYEAGPSDVPIESYEEGEFMYFLEGGIKLTSPLRFVPGRRHATSRVQSAARRHPSAARLPIVCAPLLTDWMEAAIMAIRCLKLAGIYLLIGMTMGIAMGATERFTLAPAHAHINLLGWVTLALAAAILTLWPQASATRLAHAFFWLYNLALPATLLPLSMVLLGHAQWMPLLITGELGIYVAAILLVANILVNVRGAPITARVEHAGGPHRQLRAPVVTGVG